VDERRGAGDSCGGGLTADRLTLEEVKLDLAGWVIFHFEEHEHLWRWMR